MITRKSLTIQAFSWNPKEESRNTKRNELEVNMTEETRNGLDRLGQGGGIWLETMAAAGMKDGFKVKNKWCGTFSTHSHYKTMSPQQQTYISVCQQLIRQ
jgi:hypothetical protein